ncbi:hypothetical protein BST10_07600 [Mycolicibacter algericus DSM 45454]|nr:hypothetical protein BST10_07600 [Mycolicibacter algericus DSM 45454]
MTASSSGPAVGTVARGLAGLLLGMGMAHFVWPKPFDAIIPAELPGNPRVYTHASGLGEAVIGALLLSPRTRRGAGLAAAALFVAVFPANVNCVRLFGDKPWLKAAMTARLPLQIPMIAAALRVWRAG